MIKDNKTDDEETKHTREEKEKRKDKKNERQPPELNHGFLIGIAQIK